MNIEGIAKIIAIVSSSIAILAAIIGVVRWGWKKSRFSKKPARNLDIVKVLVVQDPLNSVCKLDVTMKNKGAEDILITGLELEVVDIGRDFAKGALLPSEEYALDISHLEQVGDVGKFNLSQVIEAGKHDRFTIALSANRLGLGVFTAWRLNPVFVAKEGCLKGDVVEVWLPEPSGISFDDARETENIEEEMALSSMVQEALTDGKQVDAAPRKQVEALLKTADTYRSKRDTRGWRREMAVIVSMLNQEEKLGSALRRKLFPDAYELRGDRAIRNRKSSNGPQNALSAQDIEAHEVRMGNDGGAEAVEYQAFGYLLREPDFSKYSQLLDKLYFDPEQREQLRVFMQSEAFCENIQRRIKATIGVKEMVDCYQYIYMTDKQIAKDIFIVYGFGTRVVPLKLNEERDIETIALCLEIIGNCDRRLASHIMFESDFNDRLFLRKINEESDLEKIGNTIERLYRTDRYFAQEILESPYFDIEKIVQRLKQRNSAEQIAMSIDILKAVNKDVAKTILVSLNYPTENWIAAASLSTVHTSQPEKIIDVATVSDFIDAVGPDRILSLSSFTYQLDDWQGDSNNPYVSCAYGEFIIDGVQNLCVVSEQRIIPYLGVLPRLLSPLEHANVLTFKNCTAVTISNVELGHIPEGYCSGGVIRLINCQQMRIVDSVMFGCGVEGLCLRQCKDVHIENSEIRNCTDRIFSVDDSSGVSFNDSRLVQNRGFDLITVNNSSDIFIHGCKIENNGDEEPYLDSSIFNISEDSSVLVRDCRITGNSAGFFMKHEDSIKMENTVIEKNNVKAQWKHPSS